jgi:DNA-binding CsgD family transcriptional regulator
MDAHFSRHDVEQLSQTIRICSGPFDYPSIDDWRASVLQASTALLGGPMGHLDLFGLGLENEFLTAGYPDGVFQEWWTSWRECDPAIGVMQRHNLTVCSRRYRYRLAGEHWTAKYKRSPIYNDFYRKHALADAACIYFRHRGVGAHLHVEAEPRATDATDDRARMFLQVLQPVIQSAVQTLARPNEKHWEAYALLNALNEPTAIVGARGNWIHRTVAFDLALDAIPEDERRRLLTTTQLRAQQLLQTVFRSTAATADVRVEPTWMDGIFQLCATTIELPGGIGHGCLIRLSPRSGADVAHALAAGLSKRECGVAMLIMEGMSNKVIAERLSISEHTARRHTESILRKLGISSRSGVASALRTLLPNVCDPASV